MSKTAKTVMILGALTPFMILGGILWVGLRPEPSRQVLSSGTSSSQLASNADSSPSLLSVDSGGGNPLGGGLSQTNNQPSASSPSTAATPQNANINSTNTPNTAQGTNSDSGQAATLDPSKFAQYDIYKDAKYTNALFAELKTGSGAEAASGKTAIVNYRGWLTDGKIFDQNVSADKPFSFVLGAGSVITGWEQGIAGMKVGGERLLIIPPSVGYGPSGHGPIPGNAVLVFDVVLLGIK